ncbi:MAG: putative capsid protein [Cressdnaviricota sp.]|nr:MAG: putative capsid protein [Cressdnaviricota sp.]
MPYTKKKPSKTGKKLYKSLKKAIVPQSIKTYVNKTIHRQIENKIADFHYNGDVMYNITNNPTQWTGNNIIYLSPNSASLNGVAIIQGTGQDERIGNKIRIMKAMLSAVIYPVDELAVDKPLDVNFYICNFKQANTNTDVSTICTNKFFQDGSTSLGLSGTLADNVLRVNNDLVRCYRKFTKKLGPAMNDTNQKFINNDYKYHQQFTLDVTKYLKSVYTFNDTDQPPIDPFVCLIVSPVPCDNVLDGPDENRCFITYTVELTYEDA